MREVARHIHQEVLARRAARESIFKVYVSGNGSGGFQDAIPSVQAAGLPERQQKEISMNPHFVADLITFNSGMNGFDDTYRPAWSRTRDAWLMVPVGAINYVRLVDGDGLTVVSTDPSVTVKEVAGTPKFRRFEVKASQKGNFWIEARGQVLYRGVFPVEASIVRLQVGVKGSPTAKRIAFKYVEDSAHPKPHRTARKDKDVNDMFEVLSDVYYRQANISFSVHGKPSDAKVPVDLGSIVFDSQGSKHPPAVNEWDVVTSKGDPAADFNVFFVWSFEVAGYEGVDGEGRGGNIILQDNLGKGKHPGLILAHEVGHLLGLDHREGNRDVWLMHAESRKGFKLSQVEVDIINP